MIEARLAALAPGRETAVTIGVFDGIHLGHQALLRHLTEKARRKGLHSVVITFEPRPQTVLNPAACVKRLVSPEEREKLIRGLGVDLVATLPFNKEVARLSAREFVSLLKKHLRLRDLVTGPNFSLGRDREGDRDRLAALGVEMGFDVQAVQPVFLDGQMISSTLVRETLSQGNVELAARFLGRPFRLASEVIHGDSRGECLGFPTANLSVDREQALPQDGVYATITHTGGKAYPSATCVGSRPTFGGGDRTVEVHVLDFSGDLYGQRLGVDFVNRLREERRFGSVEALKTQIAADISKAREMLGK